MPSGNRDGETRSPVRGPCAHEPEVTGNRSTDGLNPHRLVCVLIDRAEIPEACAPGQSATGRSGAGQAQPGAEARERSGVASSPREEHGRVAGKRVHEGRTRPTLTARAERHSSRGGGGRSSRSMPGRAWLLLLDQRPLTRIMPSEMMLEALDAAPPHLHLGVVVDPDIGASSAASARHLVRRAPCAWPDPTSDARRVEQLSPPSGLLYRTRLSPLPAAQ